MRRLKILTYYFPTGTYDQINTTRLNVENTLIAMGHDVCIVNPLETLGTRLSRDKYDEYVVDFVKRENARKQVDLFFSYVRDDEMSANAVLQIRALGVPTVNNIWDIVTTHYRVRNLSKAFDAFWIPSFNYVSVLKRYGARQVFVAPSAANPRFYYPRSSREDIELSFCGQPRESRLIYIESLYSRGIIVDIYGFGWDCVEKRDNVHRKSSQFLSILRYVIGNISHKDGRMLMLANVLKRLRKSKVDPKVEKMMKSHFHGSLEHSQMVSLYSRSKITLGINDLGHTFHLRKPIVEIRLRDFEAPMSGACHIMYRVPQMLGCFEEDKEMLFYSSIEELADKIRYYLSSKQDNERIAIKHRARKRALNDHTFQMRFRKLFRFLNIK